MSRDQVDGTLSEPSALVSDDGAQRIEFDGGLTIGRHPANDLALDHRRISSRHALIEWDGERWRLKDLGSRNGTSINRRRLKEAKTLREGDVIRFASVCRWTVERLVAPSAPAAIGPTETVAGGARARDIDLFQTFETATQGTIHVRHAGGEWRLRTRQRFVLLCLLGKAGGRWVEDGELKRALWGRIGADGIDPSALHKLIHDTRELLNDRAVDGRLVEKDGGRTRLALRPGRIHVEG